MLKRSNGLGLTEQSLLTYFAKPGQNLSIKTCRTLIQDAANATDKFGVTLFVVHSSIPFAFSAAANVCVAREQCVFTLPSEHPIAAAVSAISMSSQ